MWDSSLASRGSTSSGYRTKPGAVKHPVSLWHACEEGSKTSSDFICDLSDGRPKLVPLWSGPKLEHWGVAKTPSHVSPAAPFRLRAGYAECCM